MEPISWSTAMRWSQLFMSFSGPGSSLSRSWHYPHSLCSTANMAPNGACATDSEFYGDQAMEVEPLFGSTSHGPGPGDVSDG